MLAIAVILFAAISGHINEAHELFSVEIDTPRSILAPPKSTESQWPGVCTTGDQQSPINIVSRSAIMDKYDTHIRGPLVLRGYESVNASAVNDGHALKWTIEEGASPPMVSGGPLQGNYSFVHFHMHWMSEHAIDGMKYPMEIHLVHVKTGLTAAEALERPDGMAVIAMLVEVCETSEENEYAIRELEPSIKYLLERSGGSVPASVIDVTRLISPNMQSYYTYFGSLTTPDCQEVVTWIVMDRPIRISETQFKMFTSVTVGGINNHRTLQPVNGRVIHRSRESSVNVALPSVFSLIGALLNLSSSVSGVMTKGVCTLVNLNKKFLGSDIEECSVATAFVN